MASKIVREQLKELKKQKTFDEGFIDILTNANDNNIDGTSTAQAIVDLIKQRYAKSQDNNTERVSGDS